MSVLIDYKGLNIFGVVMPEGMIITRFMPGVNEVTEAVFKVLEKNRIFCSYVKEEKIIIVPFKKDQDGKISANDMITQISRVFDRNFLNKIIKEDGRPKVVQAAQDQLDNIKIPVKDGEINKANHFR